MTLSGNARAVLQLLESTERRLSMKDLARMLPDVEDRTGAVEELLDAGYAWNAGKGRYASLKTLGMERGTIRSRADGSGVVYGDSSDGPRIEIPRENAAGALDGDLVLVRLLEPDLLRGGYRGRITVVLRRSREKVAGIARKSSGRWYLDPLDPGLPRSIPMSDVDGALSSGDLVACMFVYGRTSFSVTPLSIVGSPDSPRALIDSVCLDSALPEEFAEDVVSAAEEHAASPVISPERRDLTGELTLTVDPVDARDFDDAISISRTENGGFLLGVHIADVAAFVPPGSPMDIEAWNRGTSVYLPDRVIPMLPEVLSNGACSLRPGEERLTRSVLIEYDSTGRRKDFSVFPSRILSRRRLCYEEALELIEGRTADDPELVSVFRDFAALSDLLDRERKTRGAVDLGASEFRTDFDESGFPSGFSPVPSDKSHRMIENFMVEANSAVAEYCGWLNLDVLYRVHGDPQPEAADKLRRILSLFGYSLPGHGAPRGTDLSRAVEEAAGSPAYPLIRQAVLRSMQRAVYSPEDLGHYGLALKKYMHFTSPIRRYPDLMVHQAISAYETGRRASRSFSPAEAADSCSRLERRAESAERTATELMALSFLSRRVGKVFKGVIRDMVDFGMFVRLLDVPVEGLVHISAMRMHSRFLPPRLEPGVSVDVAVEYSDPVERKLSLLPAKESKDDGEKGDIRET